MLVVAIFVVGYLAIVFEHTLKVNKSAAALLTGVLCWTAHVTTGDAHLINEQLLHHLGDTSQILFFLLAAMTIVELIDAHEGFEIVTSRVTTTKRRKLLFTIATLTFFLSALLDNLTTAIVMMTLVRKLAADHDDRLYYGGVVVIAANAGGAWSPIGDVTTTMLWVGQQISTSSVITRVIAPAIVSAVVPTLWIALRMKGDVRRPGGGPANGPGRATQPSIADVAVPGPEGLTSINLIAEAAAIGKTLAELNLRARTGASVVSITRGGAVAAASPLEPLRVHDLISLSGSSDMITRAFDLLVNGRAPSATSALERRLVLGVGVGVLVFVPVFKALTHLPPMMGILLGLGVLWMVTELIHKSKNDEGRGPLSVAGALQRIDSQSVMFFLGILLAISALQSNGSLGALAGWLDRSIGNVNMITMAIGVASSIVDNVPLVAAAQGMYSLETFPRDHGFWLFLAYCAGTGGSILIIGSAAGIAVMGIQRISFGVYLRRFSFAAILGYVAGAATYLAMNALGL